MGNDAAADLAANGPKYDLVGPKVDDDIRRAIIRYGAGAVKDAVKRQTKPKRGRKPVIDWPELRDVMSADAVDWLNGGDPFTKRTNYSIAKAFADNNPGQSHPATMKRIIRKLIAKRRWIVLATAEHGSKDDYPHGAHLRTLEALDELDPNSIWATALDRAKSDIADYAAKTGESAAAVLTMTEIQNVSRNALSRFMAPQPLSSLFSLGLRNSAAISKD